MLERNPGLPVSVGVIVTISILVSIWLPIPAMAGDKEMNMAYPSSIEPVEYEAAYSVENGAIVSHNGARFFNRPLYGPNMQVVVLAGDRPQLRLIDEQFCNGVFLIGYARGESSKWLHEFDSITTRFYLGVVRWELSDASFPGLRVLLEAASVAGRGGGLGLRDQRNPADSIH